MNEIKCPHCGTAFTINESDYSQLLSQVRTNEFDKEVAERLHGQAELMRQEADNERQAQLFVKEKEIAELESKLKETQQQMALQQQESLAAKDLEITQLKSQLETLSGQTEQEVEKALAIKETEVLSLKAQLDKLTLEKDSEKQTALTVVEKERDQVRAQLQLQEKESELNLSAMRQDYESQLKAANEQVEFYKNFKAQQSTKAIGESLEIYAETEFNKVRHLAFPNAYFEKDNTLSSRGSKGDFIYREKDENGIEILSIMFEMKNEADGTLKKHKNEDFFKELDKDRQEKQCEYAVLVSMLESDNDYYNTGIVDVGHKYDKMYVVRPQFFIQLIGLLRNAALNALKYKQELALVREQNIDITHFEEDLDVFKTAFAKNYQSASKNFQKAIEEIDKSIKRMEAVKAALTTSENQLRLANNKLEDVSIKKLTRKNPTMKAKFDHLKGEI
ncbi:DUF2130 domain-containing protein [Streptococcus saliviloxodontae]|uniref:Serine/threonine-protein kinase MRCK beta n=1 Tax=Streptococcus saliviloxodontae TaxID=1349416 RepID=A0ABS2PM49_9STRE|nr:DUF2130 domain-containing protein [Streptococcus saliviloxodontae]MBM7636515.1 hypothetical protein [Streptococcus saliviloxodontae]